MNTKIIIYCSICKRELTEYGYYLNKPEQCGKVKYGEVWGLRKYLLDEYYLEIMLGASDILVRRVEKVEGRWAKRGNGNGSDPYSVLFF